MAKNESSENYLEAILMLSKKLPVVRSVDIANELGFKKSSVSIAMKKLRENGYILMDGDNLLSLTPAGEAIADRIYLRHTVLTQMFVALGVSEETARQDACKIEHDLSDETFEAIRRHLENIESQK